MKVLHVSFDDRGGAGRAARRSHVALLKAGIDSKMLVAKKSSEYEEVYQLNWSFLRKVWRVFQLKIEAFFKRAAPEQDKSLRSVNQTSGFILPQIEKFDADVVHLHWINCSMLRPSEIQEISVPVVWSLHDLWPLTGSCHYAASLMTGEMAMQYPCNFESLDSSGFSQKVGSQFRARLTSKPESLIVLNKNFENAVANAPWHESRKINRLKYCIDMEEYHPLAIEVTKLKQKWDLPIDKKLILFVASGVEQKHKGMDLLFGSLRLIGPRIVNDCMLVIAGGTPDEVKNLGVQYKSLGYIGDESDLAELYQMSDVFLCPSREDNFPNTVMEATACGLATVAFHTGGLPDMIEHNKTGYLAESFSVQDYAQGIEKALVNAEQWGENAYVKACESYQEQDHAKALIEVYKDIL